MSQLPLVVIPGDDPPMIAGSQHLARLRERAELIEYDTRPASDKEKIERVQDELRVTLERRGRG